MDTSTLIAGPLSKMGRTELAQIPVPQATRTHRPVPHHEIVEALVETLSFRHIGVVNEEYAVRRSVHLASIALTYGACRDVQDGRNRTLTFTATAKLGELLETQFSQSF